MRTRSREKEAAQTNIAGPEKQKLKKLPMKNKTNPWKPARNCRNLEQGKTISKSIKPQQGCFFERTS
jgi:hypothetical protein